MPIRTSIYAAVALATTLVATACGSGDGPTYIIDAVGLDADSDSTAGDAGEDATSDAGDDTDAGEDTTADAGEDATTDAGDDAGDAGEDANTDAGEDTDTDADEDTATDAGEDANTDASEDAATDATEDTATDAMDTTEDVTPDTIPDVTPDTTPDVTPDTTPDVAPDTTPDVAPDTTPDVTPDTTPDVSPDTTPDVTPDTTPDVTPDTTPDVTPDPEVCDDGVDNDGDSDVDCRDEDCVGSDACDPNPTVLAELLPCASALGQTFELWRVDVGDAGGTFLVDTTDAATTFTPAVLRTDDPTLLDGTDVVFNVEPCTVGSSDGIDCPAGELPPGVSYLAVVSAGSPGSCADNARATYELSVTDSFAIPSLVIDDGVLRAESDDDLCGDGVDNNLDGETDCEGFSCVGFADCPSTRDTVIEDALQPCEQPTGQTLDAFLVSTLDGGTARVDTGGTETAADLDLVVVPFSAVPDGVLPDTFPDAFETGNDDVACSFAPPSGRCPEARLPAGDSLVFVLSGNVCSDPSLANYTLSLTGLTATPTGAAFDVLYAPEVCDDGVDNDLDGRVDCDDLTQCGGDPACASEPEVCDDYIDNDGDGWVDCRDVDCSSAPTCEPSPGSLSPCNSAPGGPLYFDSYRISVPAGGTTITVDTVADATAFDPAIFLLPRSGFYDVLPGFGDPGFIGDDEFACTFPPPDFACPEATLGEGEYEIYVWAWDQNCADPALGEYALTFSNAGVVSELVLDDQQAPTFEFDCSDALDNDGDGNLDCADPDCAGVDDCGERSDAALTPCAPGDAALNYEYETWVLDVFSGEATVTVDTTAASTAFDPILGVLQVPFDPRTVAFVADDTVDCTFPPPQYSCPQLTFGVGRHELVVSAADPEQCVDAALGEYEITTTGDATLTAGPSGSVATFEEPAP